MSTAKLGIINERPMWTGGAKKKGTERPTHLILMLHRRGLASGNIATEIDPRDTASASASALAS